MKYSYISTWLNLLKKLQVKKFTRIWNSKKSEIKYLFLWTFQKKNNNLYLNIPSLIQRILKQYIKPGIFFGLGVRGYYTLDTSKKVWWTIKNKYKIKLQVKKDSWFFYGLVIAWKLNFLSSTITLWNVFYNEIMEKTFPLFSIRNTLVGEIKSSNLKHFFSIYLKNKWEKKKFFYVWNYPRAVNKIILL